MLNVTRMTIAALPIVEATDGASVCDVLVNGTTDMKVSRTHHHDVALDIAAKGEVSGDGGKDVYTSGRADARANDADYAGWRSVFNLIDDRKHLTRRVSRVQSQESCSLRFGGTCMQI